MWLVLDFVGWLILAFGLILESFWEHLRSFLKDFETEKMQHDNMQDIPFLITSSALAND